MQELDDQALLREYAERESAPAFAEIVSRHVDKVYSTALRHTRNPHQAEEITQAVFVILAQKARKFGGKVILAGWLYQTARLTAITFLRGEIRRARREQEALMQTLPHEPESEVWPHIAPLLDDALSVLGEKDRHAVVLRFFDGKSFGEVGAALGGSEDAAKMRVSRALEKLRTFFAKRGVKLTAAALAGLVATNSVQAAPVGLGAKVLLAAGKGSAATTTTTALVKATMKTMTWNKIRMTMAVVGMAALLAVGTATVLAQHSDKPAKAVAQIPYKMLSDACRFQDSIKQTNLVFHILIGSSNNAVKPSDIHLTIESANQGKIPVRLGSKGEILDFSQDEDLRRENPFVVSDKPKGSLLFGAWVYVPMPEGLTFRYSHLANAVVEANKAADRAKQMAITDFPEFFSGKVDGVGIVFPKSGAGKAKIIIATSAGKKEYIADGHGVIKLKINPKLQAENPLVIVSEKPDWIGIGQM